VAEKVYRQPPLRISLRNGRLNKQDFKFTKHQTTLLLAADSIGKKIQYNCRGFLPNQRQVSLLMPCIFCVNSSSSKLAIVQMLQKNGTLQLNFPVLLRISSLFTIEDGDRVLYGLNALSLQKFTPADKIIIDGVTGIILWYLSL
jgi:hypothetical protein